MGEAKRRKALDPSFGTAESEYQQQKQAKNEQKRLAEEVQKLSREFDDFCHRAAGTDWGKSTLEAAIAHLAESDEFAVRFGLLGEDASLNVPVRYGQEDLFLDLVGTVAQINGSTPDLELISI